VRGFIGRPITRDVFGQRWIKQITSSKITQTKYTVSKKTVACLIFYNLKKIDWTSIHNFWPNVSQSIASKCMHFPSLLLFTYRTLQFSSIVENDAFSHQCRVNKLCGRPPQYAPIPCNGSGSAQRQPWAMPAEPGPMSQYAPSQPCRMYATDVRRRQTDVRQHHRLMPPPRGRGNNKHPIYIHDGICRKDTLQTLSNEFPSKRFNYSFTRPRNTACIFGYTCISG